MPINNLLKYNKF